MEIKYYKRPNYGFDKEDEYVESFSKGIAKFILEPGVSSDNFDYFIRTLSPHMKSVDPKDINAICSSEYMRRVMELLHNTPCVIVAVVNDKDKGDIVVGYLHLKFLAIPNKDAIELGITLGAPDLNAGVDLGMVVHPKYHRLGIGMGLMECAIDEFVKMHNERVNNLNIIWADSDGAANRSLVDLKSYGVYDDPTIYLSVKKINTPAIALYKKSGFETVNEDEFNYKMKRTFHAYQY